MIFEIGLYVLILGSVGGACTSFVSGEFHLPGTGEGGKVWKPGFIGSIVVGGVAALILWGFYGPAASFQLIGDGGTEIPITFRVGEAIGSILAGVGGSRVLSQAVGSLVSKKETKSLKMTIDTLADVIKNQTVVQAAGAPIQKQSIDIQKVGGLIDELASASPMQSPELALTIRNATVEP